MLDVITLEDMGFNFRGGEGRKKKNIMNKGIKLKGRRKPIYSLTQDGWIFSIRDTLNSKSISVVVDKMPNKENHTPSGGFSKDFKRSKPLKPHGKTPPKTPYLGIIGSIKRVLNL